MRLANKVCFITGGGSGIGEASAERALHTTVIQFGRLNVRLFIPSHH
ncbi:MAG: hypothetical protein M0Z36_09405 [Thermaerobacter sp.]|nr:hypothetical protein [Thermaerobacter sp.]